MEWDWHWGGALDSLQQFKESIEVLRLLADGTPVPDWVRREIALWLEGKRPPFPGAKNESDVRLLAAIRDYHDKRSRPKGEGREARIQRVAQKHKVPPNRIENFLDHEGSHYRRLGRDMRRWEAIYLDPNWPSSHK